MFSFTNSELFWMGFSICMGWGVASFIQSVLLLFVEYTLRSRQPKT